MSLKSSSRCSVSSVTRGILKTQASTSTLVCSWGGYGGVVSGDHDYWSFCGDIFGRKRSNKALNDARLANLQVFKTTIGGFSRSSTPAALSGSQSPLKSHSRLSGRSPTFECVRSYLGYRRRDCVRSYPVAGWVPTSTPSWIWSCSGQATSVPYLRRCTLRRQGAHMSCRRFQEVSPLLFSTRRSLNWLFEVSTLVPHSVWLANFGLKL